MHDLTPNDMRVVYVLELALRMTPVWQPSELSGPVSKELECVPDGRPS